MDEGNRGYWRDALEAWELLFQENIYWYLVKKPRGQVLNLELHSLKHRQYELRGVCLNYSILE